VAVWFRHPFLFLVLGLYFVRSVWREYLFGGDTTLGLEVLPGSRSFAGRFFRCFPDVLSRSLRVLHLLLFAAGFGSLFHLLLTDKRPDDTHFQVRVAFKVESELFGQAELH